MQFENLLTDEQRRVNDKATPHLWCTLNDPDTNQPLPLSVIQSLTLWQWWQRGDDPRKTVKYINGRGTSVSSGQNVLNLNNVTFNATSGLLDWFLQPLDVAFQNPDTSLLEETHHFVFQWTYTASSGTRDGAWKDFYYVKRLVPSN